MPPLPLRANLRPCPLAPALPTQSLWVSNLPHSGSALLGRKWNCTGSRLLLRSESTASATPYYNYHHYDHYYYQHNNVG